MKSLYGNILSWKAVSLRASTVFVCFGVGFSAALMQQVLNVAYWPGNYAATGFGVFFTLGMLLGIALPEFWPIAYPLLQADRVGSDPGKRVDQFNAAYAVLNSGIMVVLAVTVVAAFLTTAAADRADYWSERFVLTETSWRAIATVVPAFPAWLVGAAFGGMLQFFYAAFIKLHCPQIVYSSDPSLLNVLSLAARWILVSLAAGWFVGHLAAVNSAERWQALILVPVILDLAGLAAGLVSKGGVPAPEGETQVYPAELAVDSLPEVASAPSRSARLAVMAIGWLGVWLLAQWHFCWTNWNGPDQTGVYWIGIVGVATLAAIVLGTRLTKWFVVAKVTRLLTPVDRLGLGLAAFAVLHLAALPLVAHAPDGGGIAGVVVVFILILASYFMCLNLSLPALAIGQPDRFDLWQSFGLSLIFGAIAATITLGVWQVAGGGNLVALALGSILAIATAGVTLIYDEPHIRTTRLSKRSSALLHGVSFVILYAILGGAVLIIPNLRQPWMKGPAVAVNEGPAGCAFLTSDAADAKVIGTGSMFFPVFTDTDRRDELLKLIGHIFRRDNQADSRRKAALLLGLPPLSERELSDRGLADCIQVGFDDRANQMASGATENVVTLRLYRPHFSFVVILVPTIRSQRAMPVVTSLVMRAGRLASGESGIYMIVGDDDDIQVTRAIKLARQAGLTRLSRLNLEGEVGKWTVLGSKTAIESLGRQLWDKDGAGFTITGYWK